MKNKKIERILDPFDLPDEIKSNQPLDIIKKYINKDTLKLFDDCDGKIFSFLSYDDDEDPLIEYILSLGADPNTLYSGYPIIFHFISGDYGNYYDTAKDLTDYKIRLLVEHGADFNCIVEPNKNKYGFNIEYKMTPLDYAGLCGHTPAENYLKSIGAKTAKELEEDSKE